MFLISLIWHAYKHSTLCHLSEILMYKSWYQFWHWRREIYIISFFYQYMDGIFLLIHWKMILIYRNGSLNILILNKFMYLFINFWRWLRNRVSPQCLDDFTLPGVFSLIFIQELWKKFLIFVLFRQSSESLRKLLCRQIYLVLYTI